MKNIILSTAISAVMMSGVAQATPSLNANNLPVIEDSTTYTVYLSGASAARKFMEKLFTSTTVAAADAICDNTKPMWKYKDSLGGKKQNAYLCDINKANPSLSGLTKDHLLIYKRNEGGSAQGVSPIIADAKGSAAAAIEFLKVDSTCTTSLTGLPAIGTLGSIQCAYDLADPTKVTVAIPDFGISDVDPSQFQGVNTPAGFSAVVAADAALLEVKGAAALTFGIPVTTSLRNALQEATFGMGNACVGSETEACMPSLNKAQIASIYTGQFLSWDQIIVPGTATGLYSYLSANGSANVPSGSLTSAGAWDDTVHICRRVQGSGTQAQHGIKFLNYPCFSAATVPAGDTGSATEDDGITLVHALSSSGDVTNCLNELEAGTDTDAGSDFANVYGKRWAVGIQSLEKNADLNDGFRFIKVDGVAPTLANVANGKYYDWVELTFQYSKTHAWDAEEQTIADAIIKSAGNPAVLATINTGFQHSFGQSGLLAVSTLHTANADGSLNLSLPVNPYSHATEGSAVNNCRVPARITGGDFGTGIEL